MPRVSPYLVTDEMVEDILVAAFEGGSNYWITKVDVVGNWPKGAEFASDVLTRGGELSIQVFKDKPVTLTLRAMRKGIKKAALHYGLVPSKFYEDHDAEYADIALQYALFNEIVFG